MTSESLAAGVSAFEWLSVWRLRNLRTLSWANGLFLDSASLSMDAVYGRHGSLPHF
jgi:hypothetical protein